MARALRMRWIGTLGVFLVCPLLFGAEGRKRSPEPIPEGVTPREAELGKRYSRDIEAHKDFKLIKDPEQNRKLNDIIRQLVAVSERPRINYVVKVFEDKEPNALTLPGGYIYVTSGLLEFVRSDHELAAVLAHEIGHNAHMHQMKLMGKENRFRWIDILTMIGAMAAAHGQAQEAVRSNDASKFYAPLIFQRAMMEGLINRYSIEYEREADDSAFAYLAKTPYNPVGLLTFMERLQMLEQRRPYVDFGVFMTHPTTKERVAAAQEQLQRMGVPLDRAAVTAGPKPRVESLTIDAGGAAQVKVGDLVLFKLAGETPEEALQRAQAVADRLEKSVARGLRSFDLRKSADPEGISVLAGRDVLATVAPRDVSLNDASSADALAQKWIDSIRRLLFKGSLSG